MNIIYKIDIVCILIIIPIILGNISKPDDWYYNLKRPKLTPPGYVFGIVWSILYLMIALSYYYALWDKSFDYWIIPIIHLLLNYSYTPLIFIYKRLFESAFITSLILITAIIVMILFYSYGSMISVYLLIPYIIWLSFANYLAWSVYLLNN